MSFNALLPSAKIAVFTQDNQTKDVMASLDGDWRFARVDFDIQIGDVETATAHYENEHSPDLLYRFIASSLKWVSATTWLHR